jgi:23S rRNA (cytidine1920-2'-O)/16S rRNA (cytidine1409-2'-O)-methyltransferase
MRLDNYLVQNGFFESRNRAQEAIKSGLVLIDNKVVKKPSYKVEDGFKIEVKEQKFYVSRAAKKLEGYLKEFNLPIKGARALDVGSSTGGFTQILLENGAKSVDCVDVGKEQLHSSLRKDSRVSVFEQTDIRDFNSTPYDLIVSDVSFISLLKIIDSIDRLIKKGGVITLLFKPQFEVGLGVKRDSRGVVLDKEAIKEAKSAFLDATKDLNWNLIDTRESRVSGKEGNVEYFYTFIKEES